MTQNRSNAVMASRVEPHDSLEFFPTRAWATRALCEWLTDTGKPLKTLNCWEPACGEGHMSKPLAEYFDIVHSSDVHPYGFGAVEDFLLYQKLVVRADWIITNPPFRLGEQFVRLMIERARLGCAVIVRTAFLESASRYENLFKASPPSDILQFTERVPMHKGRVEAKGSTATAYCWIVFRKNAPAGTRFHWIAPCRTRLERASDYEAAK